MSNIWSFAVENFIPTLSQTSQEAQVAYKKLWGDDIGTVEARQQEMQNLRHVQAGDQVYDLADPEQFEKFLQDMGDGCLDGAINERSTEMELRDNKLSVLTPDGETVSFDLANPVDVMKLQRDSADGKIDGMISKTSKRGKTGQSEGAGEGSAVEGDSKPIAPGDSKPVTTSQSGSTSGASGSGSGEKSTAQKEGESANELYRKGMDAIAGYDPEQLMAMQREGRLPPDVVASPAAMAALQAKIMAYHEMIQMISQQLKMDHDIRMAITRNMTA
jgi:hypothetical protein